MKVDAKFRENNEELTTRFQEENAVFPVVMQENAQTLSTTYQENYKPFEAGFTEDEMRIEAKFSETQVVGSGSGSGKDGEDGLSAYEIAVKNGFKGSEKEWLASLKGDPGEDGLPGTPGESGESGATFTPHVDEEGNLSWTNDKGLENPETVNIKGETPEVRILTAVNTSTNGTKYGVAIEGPKIVTENGDIILNSATVWDGADGKPGVSMHTFDSDNGLAADGTLDTSYVNVPEGYTCKKGDLLLDQNGDVYTVGAETNGYGHVARWTATFVFSIKGIDGEPGADGLPGRDGIDGITPHVGENGNWFIGDVDTGIPATGPEGKQGLPGKDGSDGQPGKDGRDGVDGKDGQDGNPGADGQPGKDGSPGKDGKDGYTPVRGTDYWTDADKNEIISEAKNAIANQSNVTSYTKPSSIKLKSGMQFLCYAGGNGGNFTFNFGGKEFKYTSKSTNDCGWFIWVQTATSAGSVITPGGSRTYLNPVSEFDEVPVSYDGSGSYIVITIG